MSIFLFVILSLFLVPIYSNFTVVHKTTNIYSTTRQLTIEIDQPVNPPSFQSFIYFNNATTNLSIYQIDVHSNASNVTYLNNTLTINIAGFNVNDEFYITFDAGVFFSNPSVNSTAQMDSQFWDLQVIDVITTTSATTLENTSMGNITVDAGVFFSNPSVNSTAQMDSQFQALPVNDVITTTSATTLGNTSMGTTQSGTTQSGTTDTSMSYSGSSAFTMTTVTSSYTSTSQTTQNPSTTSTTPAMPITGESPPTRSAQIGMGLGITFITILIVAEIVYFKYCYSGNGRSDSYFT